MAIETYSEHWRNKVSDLAGDVFGDGFFALPSEIAKLPNSLLLLSQENDRDLTGFAQGEVWPLGRLQELLAPLLDELPPELADADANGVLGVIQAVAVAPGSRRRGIATTLLRVLHDRLVGLGADKLIIMFKRGPSASPVDGVMRKIGFEPWTAIPSYWRDGCDAGQLKCPDRQNGCVCDALMYRKAVY